ncbi:Rgp1-domain-containing protein [Dendrothele bispora CBS 962.96]|uniref:Rgp1-domain-containing protein n=1 Tax=Dendrothele bispora (strain CBS 962.96) TaxID=1314807 RepID=A0A4S8M3G5_DENBC|nr:Rgp1-domain-containing protein [Dendrothele bispora CBS 962.96]
MAGPIQHSDNPINLQSLLQTPVDMEGPNLTHMRLTDQTQELTSWELDILAKHRVLSLTAFLIMELLVLITTRQSANKTEAMMLKGSVVLTPLPSPSGSRSRSVSSLVSSRVPSTSTGTSNSVNPYSPNPTSSGTKYGPTPLPPPFPTSASSLSSQSPHVTHVTDVQLTPAQVLALLRTSLLKSSAGAVGGGSMDIGRMTSSLGSNSSLSLLSRQGPKSNLGGGRGHTRSSLSIDVGNANANLNLGSAMSSDTPSSGTRPPHKRSSSIGMGMGLLNALLGPSSPALDPADNRNGYSSPMHASRSAPDVSNPGYPSGVVGSSVYNPISGRIPAEGRSRAVSASASASSLNGGYSGGSFGSIGSLGAWLTGSSPNPSSSVSSGVGLGGGVGKEIDAETPLPTFEVPPAMLAVDMVLKPGEERSYTYTLLLPPDLPPTFRGRTFRFSYELVIGIGVRRGSGSILNPSKSTGLGLGIAGISDSSGQERILSSSSMSASQSNNARGSGPGPSGGSTSKIMQIPIRVYTNVVVGRSPTPYDLLWPVYKRQQQGFAPGHRRGGRGVASSPLAVTKYKKSGSNKDMYMGKVEEIAQGNDRNDRREVDGDGTERILDKDRDKDKGLDELREYAKGLVDATTTISRRSGDSEADEEDQTITVNRQLGQNSPVIMNGHNKDNLGFGPSESVAASGNGKVGIGCGEAVEILTRNQKKVSYDVNKDGVKVAVLTFTKAAYRLGETVQGVMELNERTSRARVVQLSAHLETHESLPTALASPPSSGSPGSRELKRVHAEHYSSFVLLTMRTTFSLDIPSNASAAFQIKVGNEKATGHGETLSVARRREILSNQT